MRMEHKEKKIMRLLKNYQRDVLERIMHKAQLLEKLLEELKQKGIDEDMLIAIESPNMWIEISYATIKPEIVDLFIRQLKDIENEDVLQYFANHNNELFEVLRIYSDFTDMESLIDKWMRVSKAISDLK